MIKTDLQLQRTRESIAAFRQQLEDALNIDDSVERELTVSSFEGMIAMLQLEIDRYLTAKEGIVRVPSSVKSIVDLCPFLTDIRLALGWTQERLASQLGVSRQAVNQWEEHEYRNLDVPRLQQIIEALGVITAIGIEHNAVRIQHAATSGSGTFATAVGDDRNLIGMGAWSLSPSLSNVCSA